MADVVVFLGAGATKACGGPLTSEILPQILQAKSASIPSPVPGAPQRVSLLEQFLCDLFHVSAGLPKELYPSLPLLMSLLDTALDRRQTFHPNWDAARVSELRSATEVAIFDLLEEKLNLFPTNNHWQLLNKVFIANAEPRIISTNYDLVIDTALMYFSQTRNPEGRFPDYRCQIRTDFYSNEPAHFGMLLKLHGSLNWLYCKTCHRLEIGASESKRFLKVLDKVVGRTTLRQFYTPDGSLCPTCQTKLRPLLIAPTYLKDYRNPHLAAVWYESERALREAKRVIFVGYSLPDDDVEVVYLLKRSLAHLPSHQVTVIELDESKPVLAAHPVGRRYRALFGDGIDWHPEGLDAWIEQSSSVP